MRPLLLLLPLLCVAQTLHGQHLRVCPSCDYTSITTALDQAQPGDSLIIGPGTYKEGNIKITKPVALVGIDYPIIDAEQDNEAITVTSDSVYISGLQIQNVGTSYIEDRSAIRLIKSNYCRIENNKFFNTFFAIHYEHSSHGIVRNNYVKGNAVLEMSSGNAVHVWYCKHMLIEGNTLLGMRDGIYLEFVDSSRILNNHSEDNIRYGMHFMFSDDDYYSNNFFRSNGAGVAVMYSDRIAMADNIFEQNWGTAAYGLLLKEIHDSDIHNNIFRKNTTGVYGESANRINFFNNDFISNGWAMRIMGSCEDNVIERNNFLSNTFDITTSSSHNNNTYQGNYWSGYSGYDLDHDGFGDVPYRPVSLFSYVISRAPTSIVLLRSLFIEVLNFAEKVTPVITPESLSDDQPRMKKVTR